MSVINRTIKNNSAGLVNLYTVPSGKTAVVTNINHCNQSTADRDVYTHIIDTTTSPNQFSVIDVAKLAENTSQELIGSGQKLVLNANDSLTTFKVSSGTVDTIVTLMEID